MDFKYKLIFLMELTDTKNKQLASALTVDPSLISRLRSGDRKIPQNSKYIRTMSEYFASRCINSFQYDALAESIGNSFIDFSSQSEISDVIEAWLNSDLSEVQTQVLDFHANNLFHSFENIEITFNEEYSEEFHPKKLIREECRDVYTFFGSEGKQDATLFFEELVLSKNRAVEVKIMTEGNTDWLWMDREYSKKVTSYIKTSVLNGCMITQIVPQNQNIAMSFESVRRWFIPYMVGRVNSYYYPYQRDQIFNRTLYVATDIAALESTTIRNDDDGILTIVTTDSEVVKALDAEFLNYLSLCKPATTIYNHNISDEKYRQCVFSFLKYQSNGISINGGLSLFAIPEEMFKNFIVSSLDPFQLELIQAFMNEICIFEQLMKNYKYTEIINLESVEAIVSGDISCMALSVFDGASEYYTPRTYSLHLKNIIDMLEKYPNYNIIVLDNKEFNSNIYIKEDYGVLISPRKTPNTITCIKYKEMVSSIYQYSKKKIDVLISDASHKRQTIYKLKCLINKLAEYRVDKQLQSNY